MGNANSIYSANANDNDNVNVNAPLKFRADPPGGKGLVYPNGTVLFTDGGNQLQGQLSNNTSVNSSAPECTRYADSIFEIVHAMETVCANPR